LKSLIICIFSFTILSWAQTPIKKEALELNEKAHRSFPVAYRNADTANYVLNLLDQAIANDSLCIAAYLNKIFLSRKLGRRNVALNMVNRLTRVCPDIVGINSIGGFILDRMGKTEEARGRYLQDVAKYDSIISCEVDSLKINAKVARAMLIPLLNGKDEGIKEYEKILAEHPNSEYVMSLKEFFYEFDRNEFLTHFCK
jgi:tetratricopeptide (TPR) repeat protein